MKVLVAGAGRLGEQAAHLLAATGHQITVIERDRARLAQLPDADLLRLVHGDACEPAVLEHAGVRNTDLLLATTGEDEDNLVIALLSKRQFTVARTMARVNDPDNAWLFDARWGVDVALPAAASLVPLIEEASGASDTVGLLRLAAAGVTVIATHIDDHSAASGRPLSGIDLPAGTVVAAVVHDSLPVVPRADYRFRGGDTVLVVSATADEHDVRTRFQ